MTDFSDIGAEISSLMEEIDGNVPAPKPRVVEKAVPQTSLQEAMNRVRHGKMRSKIIPTLIALLKILAIWIVLVFIITIMLLWILL